MKRKKDERSLLRPHSKNQSRLLTLKNPNNQNLPLALQSVSLNFPQTEISEALQNHICHTDIKCIKVFC